MDDKSLNLSPKLISGKVFTANVKGYDPDEVDRFLDLVVEDYRHYEKYSQDSAAYIQSLETTIAKLQEEIKEKDMTLARANNQLRGVSERGVNASNIDLIQYIDRLERALYARGIDPRSLK